jgi:hypothetical protein
LQLDKNHHSPYKKPHTLHEGIWNIHAVINITKFVHNVTSGTSGTKKQGKIPSLDF